MISLICESEKNVYIVIESAIVFAKDLDSGR